MKSPSLAVEVLSHALILGAQVLGHALLRCDAAHQVVLLLRQLVYVLLQRRKPARAGTPHPLNSIPKQHKADLSLWDPTSAVAVARHHPWRPMNPRARDCLMRCTCIAAPHTPSRPQSHGSACAPRTCRWCRCCRGRRARARAGTPRYQCCSARSPDQALTAPSAAAAQVPPHLPAKPSSWCHCPCHLCEEAPQHLPYGCSSQLRWTAHHPCCCCGCRSPSAAPCCCSQPDRSHQCATAPSWAHVKRLALLLHSSWCCCFPRMPAAVLMHWRLQHWRCAAAAAAAPQEHAHLSWALDPYQALPLPAQKGCRRMRHAAAGS